MKETLIVLHDVEHPSIIQKATFWVTGGAVLNNLPADPDRLIWHAQIEFCCGLMRISGRVPIRFQNFDDIKDHARKVITGQIRAGIIKAFEDERIAKS